MNMEQNRYALRGVSSSKEEVHAVVDQLEKGLFPGAFCKINPDFLTGNPKKMLRYTFRWFSNKKYLSLLTLQRDG